MVAEELAAGVYSSVSVEIDGKQAVIALDPARCNAGPVSVMIKQNSRIGSNSFNAVAIKVQGQWILQPTPPFRSLEFLLGVLTALLPLLVIKVGIVPSLSPLKIIERLPHFVREPVL